MYCFLSTEKKSEKMQQPMPVTPQALTLNPLKDAAKVDKIDYSADFENLFSKMDDFNKLFRNGKISYNMLKYIPGLAKAANQSQLEKTETKRRFNMQMILIKVKT